MGTHRGGRRRGRVATRFGQRLTHAPARRKAASLTSTMSPIPRLTIHRTHNKLMPMDDTPKSGMPAGALSMLILRILQSGSLHGYAIAREIERRSGDALTFGEGALYPALRALERQGCAVGTWEVQESGPARRAYSLTEQGLSVLEENLQEWNQFTVAVNSVLTVRTNAQPI